LCFPMLCMPRSSPVSRTSPFLFFSLPTLRLSLRERLSLLLTGKIRPPFSLLSWLSAYVSKVPEEASTFYFLFPASKTVALFVNCPETFLTPARLANSLCARQVGRFLVPLSPQPPVPVNPTSRPRSPLCLFSPFNLPQ